MAIAVGSNIISGNARVANFKTICNPNLLINSNFKINTQGQETYTEFNKDCVDKWTLTKSDSPEVSCVVKPVANGLSVKVNGSSDAFINISQKLTRSIPIDTKFAISFKTEGYEAKWDAFENDGTNNCYFYQREVTSIGPRVVYNVLTNTIHIRVYADEDIIINYIKVERGENGTMYVDPDPALELVRCNTDAESGSETYDLTASKPNILINPDFSINQRGEVTYDLTGYTVDRWYTNGCKLLADGTGLALSYPIKLRFGTGGSILQYIEKLPAGTYTLSVKLAATTANVHLLASGNGTKLCEEGLNIFTFKVAQDTEFYYVGLMAASEAEATVEYIKLEAGNSASLYTVPDPAIESLRCQRYYQLSHDHWDLDHHDLRPSMRHVPTTAMHPHGYSYDAEIHPEDL